MPSKPKLREKDNVYVYSHIIIIRQSSEGAETKLIVGCKNLYPSSRKIIMLTLMTGNVTGVAHKRNNFKLPADINAFTFKL